MGQLFLVDDNVTQEEILKQVSHDFILTAKNKKGRLSGKKQINIRRKVKTVLVISSPKTDSKMDEVPSSSTYQDCELQTQNSQTEAGFQCGKEDDKKIMGIDDEMPGNSHQTRSIQVSRKRKTTNVIEDHAKTYPKRTRKNSCEILKEELRRSISNVGQAKSTPEIGSFEVTDEVPSFNHEDRLEEPTTSSDVLISPGYAAVHRKNRSQARVGLNDIQDFKIGTSDNSCVVRPNYGKKMAKIKMPNNVEKVGVDDDADICSRSNFEKVGEVYKCDNHSGTEKHDDSFAESCSSSCESRVSESRGTRSEWILSDKDSSFCLKRVFDAEDVSVAAPAVLDESRRDSDHILSKAGTSVRLPAVADIPDWMYVAVDCEMVGVGPKGKHSVLARCSIVDYNGRVVYDKYIKPSETITDYRTPWSGIRPVHMRTAVPINQALPDIKECLAHKVVIGHAVYHDFKVLGITPDHHFVRDTAQCPQLVGMAQLQGKGNSLKKLSEALLDRKIQVGKQGHCSVEDARATLDLFKLVRHSWEPALYLKWSQKEAAICDKVASFVDMATRQRDVHSTDDFLNDIFWPSDIAE